MSWDAAFSDRYDGVDLELIEADMRDSALVPLGEAVRRAERIGAGEVVAVRLEAW